MSSDSLDFKSRIIIGCTSTVLPFMDFLGVKSQIMVEGMSTVLGLMDFSTHSPSKSLTYFHTANYGWGYKCSFAIHGFFDSFPLKTTLA